jgi:hypothetical protein
MISIRCIIILIILFSTQLSLSCDKWFDSLKIKDVKNCPSKCRTSQTDMATYLCPQQCDLLCKRIGKPALKDSNFYDLTDAEVTFCKSNPISCAKAYNYSWQAEKQCLTIYVSSNTNDESDACRHYIWALFLVKNLGENIARKVLNGHEDNPKQDPKKKKWTYLTTV